MAESFQYVKEFWIILLLIYIFIKKRELIFIVFSLIFMFIFADDLLMLHEKLGTDIRDYFSYPQMLGLRGQDLGEVTVYAFFGLFFFILLIVAYYRSNNELRIIGRNLFLLLIIFGFFGGVIDIIDSLLRNYKYIQRIMKILEDGGEMILMSFICWYVFTLSSKIDDGNILSS